MNNVYLVKVKYLPKELEEGLLYFSEEYKVAGHLCPCGCFNKIITPIGEREWSLEEHNNKPSLYPSIGNWQLPCRSHYWIIDGEIRWSYNWTDEQVEKGRWKEEISDKQYYDNLYRKNHRKSIVFSMVDFFKKK